MSGGRGIRFPNSQRIILPGDANVGTCASKSSGARRGGFRVPTAWLRPASNAFEASGFFRPQASSALWQ